MRVYAKVSRTQRSESVTRNNSLLVIRTSITTGIHRER
ncbi:unnamed protein product [Soboliphyme baturini]|uniref:Kinesin motor domain-containing protein n=1 Tax=Soboliphyme baturini TaxID=241478 RepID=A0A183JB69_9BILA|nr:unnamed protein product [Soboliphyme baturini]